MTDNEEVPDFSGDDFANDKEIQQSRAAKKAYQEMVDKSILLLQEELKVQESSHTNFKVFTMFRSLNPIITYSMKSVEPGNKLRVSFASYYSAYPVPRNSNSGHDQYLFGCLSLKNNYPATYIHRETLREKIEDIFLKRDVDFPHSRKFSRRFQVLTADKNRLENLWQLKDLDALTVFPEMELEISNDMALFRNSRKPFSLEETREFCDLTKVLLTIFD